MYPSCDVTFISVLKNFFVLYVKRSIDCSTSQGIIPPVGFAIISRQFHIVKHLIGLDGFDTSTLGVSSALVAVCIVTYFLPIPLLSS